MRRVFNIAVLMLLAYLTAGRALTHAQAGEEGSISCAKGAELVRLGAMDKGFSDAASSGQGQNFLSSCLVTGEGRVNNLVARD
ncbi:MULTISPECIES: hypothetical protein [Paraburkholderia]|jgi:hypothetical protein|uniref:Uncharacterized protein n=1 Tax=Paraburkholderia phenazinium TaxID=60549 RepID=A0A1N6JYJ5_9BURK|nr:MULTISPECIES: hypothetical protein [Paraburkholderia]SIO49197.1 hypothetical protein SAMN05444168_5407 [Paraburkholderia phenazinium]